MPSLRILSTAVDTTEEIGRALGSCVNPGSLITMSGQLGAGKTAMTRGIARGLGIKDSVTSPTFTLAQIYGPGERRLMLHHNDVYRLESAEDFEEAGLAESLETDAITVVEWAERVADALPDADVSIALDRNAEEADLTVQAQLVTADELEEPDTEQILLPEDDVPRVVILQFKDKMVMERFLVELTPEVQVLDKGADT